MISGWTERLLSQVPLVAVLFDRLVRVALCAAVLLLPAGSAALAARLRAVGVSSKVVAKNLDNPRKIAIERGAIYVVEAGHGGRDKCLGRDVAKVCIGLTGSITQIVGGVQTRVVTGLWSGARPDGQRAQGPADVLVRDGTYDVLLQDGVIDAKGQNSLGRDGAKAGDLISTPPGNARPVVIADLASFEAAHNPDRGAGPGPQFGDMPIDSDPYAFTPYRGGFAVADAAANDLLWISPAGTVSVLAVFPTQRVKLTLATRRAIGAPPTMASILVQSVPTSVTVGPDGALYVGELTGVPFQPGTARIWRIAGKVTLYASGFTNISDLAFDGKDLLVLEMASRGLLDRSSPGALIRLRPGGRRTVLVSAGLVAPTGLAVGNGAAYISNYGLSPGAGSGHHGEVVEVTLK
jgi:hypothetical protein